MKFGVVVPAIIGADPILLRDFVQMVEELEYDYILAYEQIVEPPAPPLLGWPDSLMMLSYIAALTDLELATGIVVLPSRETILIAKQVAQLDRLTQGRFRFGVSAGWNSDEYQAMGVSFAERGQRLDEQVDLLRQLWSEADVSFAGDFHSIEHIAVHPQPVQDSISIWFGGHTDRVLKRIAQKQGAGWMVIANDRLTPQTLPARLDVLRSMCEETGHDFSRVGIEIVDVRPTEPRDWPEWIEQWQSKGATHLDICTRDQGLVTPQEHLDAIRQFKELTF